MEREGKNFALFRKTRNQQSFNQWWLKILQILSFALIESKIISKSGKMNQTMKQNLMKPSTTNKALMILTLSNQMLMICLILVLMLASISRISEHKTKNISWVSEVLSLRICQLSKTWNQSDFFYNKNRMTKKQKPDFISTQLCNECYPMYHTYTKSLRDIHS